ncbi:MAG TPA: response regulator [Anaeromyxobacteraceae bacterium]|nr:response regulator [Anaeromyxobacteraceae bacterium]
MARVLIVDDTDIVRRALELAVRRMGHLAVSTSDAVEALAMARRQPPDLALLDYRMPGMDGATLFRELRESLGERCPKVLWVSATPQEQVARETAEHGPAAGFVKKPFHLDELIRQVGEALASA